uniref:Aminotransferase-like plant mobile domain-containing protein n=1 Tax=Oryza glaberrima TaxID=4538 RepID=I1Q6L3_ORYGL
MTQWLMPMYNAAVLTTFVDRWRPEVHTFHLSSGELMVTLEDNAMILVHPSWGQAVTSDTSCGTKTLKLGGNPNYSEGKFHPYKCWALELHFNIRELAELSKKWIR